MFVSFLNDYCVLAEWANSNVIIKWLENFNLDYTFNRENPKRFQFYSVSCDRIIENVFHFRGKSQTILWNSNVHEEKVFFFLKKAEHQLWMLCHERQSIEKQLLRNSFSIYNSFSNENPKRNSHVCVFCSLNSIQFNQNQFLIVQRIGSGFFIVFQTTHIVRVQQKYNIHSTGFENNG